MVLTSFFKNRYSQKADTKLNFTAWNLTLTQSVSINGLLDYFLCFKNAFTHNRSLPKFDCLMRSKERLKLSLASSTGQNYGFFCLIKLFLL